MKKLAVLFALITGAFLSGFTGEGFAGAIAPAVTAGQPEAVNTGVTPVYYRRWGYGHRWGNGRGWGYGGWGFPLASTAGYGRGYYRPCYYQDGGSYGSWGRPAYYGYGARAWEWWPYWDFPQNILR